MAATKKTETKAAVLKEEVKPVVLTAEVVKEAETKKEAAPKKVAVPKKPEAALKKTAAPKKEAAVKKTAEPKKETVKKAPAKKEIKTKVYVQYLDKELLTDKLVAEAKKAYVKAGNKEADIKTIELYVKPEENAAYFAINGVGSDEYKINL